MRETTMTETIPSPINPPEPRPATKRVSDPELIAMSEINSILDELQPRERSRVTNWLFDRWGGLDTPVG